MGRLDSADIAGVGLDDSSRPAMPRDEARSLLGLFAVPDREARGLGAAMLRVPNGQDLYVTNGAPGLAALLPG